MTVNLSNDALELIATIMRNAIDSCLEDLDILYDTCNDAGYTEIPDNMMQEYQAANRRLELYCEIRDELERIGFKKEE